MVQVTIIYSNHSKIKRWWKVELSEEVYRYKLYSILNKILPYFSYYGKKNSFVNSYHSDFIFILFQSVQIIFKILHREVHSWFLLTSEPPSNYGSHKHTRSNTSHPQNLTNVVTILVKEDIQILISLMAQTFNTYLI